MKSLNAYVVLLRGINVGGKNKVPMAALRKMLEELGFSDVSTYIASGNVLLRSASKADDVKAQIEKALPKAFKLDSELIRVLVLTRDQLAAVIKDKPRGFGAHPEEYHSDAIFLMDTGVDEAMAIFDPKEGVDTVWPGKGVIYSQRLSSERTKSRLGKIIGTLPYKSMTIRNWNTTTRLLELMKGIEE